MRDKHHNETAIPESSILVPRDPSLDENSDEWPEFDLSQVDVYTPGDHKLRVSLLEAGARSPLSLRGQLAPLPAQQRHLYRIAKPSHKKTDIELTGVKTFSYGQFGDGSIAIWAAGEAGWYRIKPSPAYKSTYDDMMDAVKTFYFIADTYKGSKGVKKGAKSNAASDDVIQLFANYAKQMLPGNAKADKGQQKMHKHRRFILSSMLAGKEGLDWTNSALYKHFCDSYPELLVELNGGDVRDGDGIVLSNAGNDGQPPKNRKRKRDAVMQSDSKLIEDTARHSSASISPSSEISSTAPSQIPAKAAGQYRAKPRTVTPRKQSPSVRTTTPPQQEESEDEIPSRQKSGLRLRARASKYVKPSLAGRGKANGLDPVELEDNSDSPTTQDPASAYDVLHATRRPSAKRRHSRLHTDEGIDMPTSPSTAGDSEIPPEPDGHELAIRTLHNPDPVQEDTWVCALDGCMHKVYAASDPESQRLIREHYALHAYDDDERVQLVKKLHAPSLPVSRLMDKVRAQAKLEGFPGSRVAGTRYPATLPEVAATMAGVVQRY